MDLSGFFDEVVKLAMSQLDVLLIVAIVFLIQRMKAIFTKAPKKLWFFVMIAMGFVAAWIVTPQVVGHGKQFLRQGFLYVAGSEFLYQTWRSVKEIAISRLPKKG